MAEWGRLCLKVVHEVAGGMMLSDSLCCGMLTPTQTMVFTQGDVLKIRVMDTFMAFGFHLHGTLHGLWDVVGVKLLH